MASRGGRLAVYIEGHAESLTAAAGEGTAAVDKLAASTERLDVTQATAAKGGFASYASVTRSTAKETKKASGYFNEHGKVTSKMGSIYGNTAKSAVALIGAYAGYSAVKNAITYTEELAHQTEILSAATGLDSKTASRWIELGKQRGVTAQNIGVTFKTLSKQMREAEQGSSSATKAFHALGIPIDDLQKMKPEQVMLRVADAFHHMDDGAKKTALNTQLFGKSSLALLPILNEGKKGVEDQLGAFGGLSKAQEEQAKEAKEIQRTISRAYDQIRLDVTFALLDAGKATASWISETAKGKGTVGEVGKAVVGASKEIAQWVGNAVPNAVHATVTGFKAFTGAVSDTIHWIGRAVSNVKGFVGSLLPVKAVLLTAKLAVAPLVLAVKGLIKVTEIFSPAIRAAAHVVTSVFGVALKATGVIIGTLLKTIGNLGSVVGDVVGVVSNLLRGKWGNAWDDAKQLVVDVWHTIADVIKGAWTLIKTTVSGGVSTIKTAVGSGFGAIKDVATNVWHAVTGTFKSGVNKAIGFLDTLIEAINLIPGVPDIETISPIGGGEAGRTDPTQEHNEKEHGRHTPQHRYSGGPINRPMAIVGEEAPQHPEWVIATNPAYRRNNISYWMQAGHDLGVPGFKSGGLLGAAEGAVESAANTASGVFNSAKGAIASLPTPHLPHWISGLGGYVVDKVKAYITSGFRDKKLGHLVGGTSGKAFKHGKFTFPLPAGSWTAGQVDQGWDLSAPGHTPLLAVADGVVKGHGISGFGPWAPILGLGQGTEVYYGHAGPGHELPTGTKVKAGQVIGEVGAGIVGISTGPHLEIGFYPPGPMGAGEEMKKALGYAKGGLLNLGFYKEGGSIKGPWAGTSIDRTFPASDGYHGSTLPRYTIEALAEWAGLPGKTMYEITEGESMGHPGMDISDPPGRSRGLYAINDHYNPEFGATAMRNPILNTLAAAKLAGASGGPNPNIWHGSSHVTGWDLHYKGDPLAIAQHLGGGGKGGSAGAGSKSEKPKTGISGNFFAATGTPATKFGVGKAAPSVLGALPAGTITGAAAGLPPSIQALLRQPGLSLANQLAIGHLAGNLAAGTEGTEDDIAAARFTLGLEQSSKKQIEKSLVQVAQELKHPATPKRRKRLLAKQQRLLENLASTTEAITSDEATIGGGASSGAGGGNSEQRLQEIVALLKEGNEAKDRTINVLTANSNALVNSLIAVVTGGIGGKVGLGFQTPSFPGRLADY